MLGNEMILYAKCMFDKYGKSLTYSVDDTIDVNLSYVKSYTQKLNVSLL